MASAESVAAAAAERWHGPAGGPTASATLSFHSGCCCSSSSAADGSADCSRSWVKLSAPIVMKAH